MNIVEKAREIVNSDAWWDFDSREIMDDTLHEMIAAALHSVRNETIEEAARVAEAQKETADPHSYEMAHVCIGMDMAAAAIRNLKKEGT